ncbi:uncharacterized protein PGTG_15749, partial [Puccinia graminis f. sp. tritici CRL 75-36-700-3]
DTGAEEYDAEETDDGERACPNECSGVRGTGGKKEIHRNGNEDGAWVRAFLRGGPVAKAAGPKVFDVMSSKG